MPLFLLFMIPLVVFGAIATIMVAALGFALPLLQAHGLHFVGDAWFQALIKLVLLVLTVVMPVASILTWMERKQSAMMQDRIGPNRASVGGVRAWGILHFVADAIKMIMKEDFVPARANRFLFALAPLLAITPVFVVFAIIPFGGDICPSQLFGQLREPVCSDSVRMQVAHLDAGL